MKRYLAGHFWEWIACLMIAASMIVFFSQGFYIADRLADNVPLALLISGAVLFACYLLGYNRIGLILCPVILAVVVLLGIVLLRAGNVDIVDMEGSESSAYIYLFAVILLPIVSYLLSRTRIGLIVLYAMGAALIGAIKFLAYDVHVWWCALFVVGSVILLALRIYRKQARISSTIAPKFKNLFYSVLLVALIGTGAAGGLYYGLIRPMNPPTVDMELITRFLSYNVLDRIGVARHYTIPDDLIRAALEQEIIESRNQEAQEDPDEDRQDEETDENNDKEKGDRFGAGEGISRLYEAVTYWLRPERIALLVIVLAAVIVFLTVFLKRILWHVRIARLKKQAPAQRVMALCRFYMERFRRMGFQRGPAQTEQEYARSAGQSLDRYLGEDLSLDQMMRAYDRARYGGLDPDEAVWDKLAGLYPKLRKNYRKQNGWAKYLLKYLRL